MSIREKLTATAAAQPAMAAVPPAETPGGDALASSGMVASDAYKQLKSRLHAQMLEKFDLTALETLPVHTRRQEISAMTEKLLQSEQAVINDIERRSLVRDIQNEMLGFGPLELLMADPQVSDILVNSYDQIYVERRGRLELSNVTFTDERHLMRIIDKIVSHVGRRIDESSPMVDARLPDGSRVNAILPPIALDGPMVSIRRFAHIPLKMDNLVNEYKSLTPEMAQVLEGLVQAKVNLVISGGTGSGKTTLLNILSGYIPATERVITIEDAAELQLQQPHVVRLETRPSNLEGRGEITQRALVRNALRMRPDRIIVGEVRGPEAADMLQAMNTGHEGSMTTIHANSPRDALSRLENMIGMADLNLPQKAVRQQIASAITVIVQVLRLVDGRRRVTSIQEITGMEGEVVTMQEIHAFKQTGIGKSGEVEGYFQASGIRPKFIERLHAFGVDFNESAFDPARVYR